MTGSASYHQRVFELLLCSILTLEGKLTIINTTKEGGRVTASVCLCVTKVTQKVMNGF